MTSGRVTVLIDRWTLAEELWSFGEDEHYLAPLAMSDEEMIRLWVLAGEIYERHAARSGSEAAALAAIALVERRRRPLARSRRRSKSQRPSFGQTLEQRMADVHRIRKEASFPHAWD